MPSPRLMFISRAILGFLVTAGALYLSCYVYFRTPLPHYLLDKLNLRRFALPNILCNNCTQIPDTGYLISNETLCKGRDIFLLNVIISFHANVISRRNIRNTWGGVKYYRGKDVQTIFAFGIHEDANFNNQLHQEQKEHNDILQINAIDSYRRLTEKTITVFKWISQHCPSARYILKTDDDSFNNVPRIMDYLLTVQQEYFVGGYCFTVTPDRRKDSKYYVPKSSYPDVYYPTYCAGPGYIMSQAATKAILKVYANVIYLPMEDVYITGMCREAAHIKYTVITGMIVSAFDHMSPCDLATWSKNTHNVVPESMLALWNKAKDADPINDCINKYFRKFIFLCIALASWIKIVTYMIIR